MFTGIIIAVGTVVRADLDKGDMRAIIDVGSMQLSDVIPGDSICVNGVCLTVTGISANTFTADISSATLSCTTFHGLVKGMSVNLEKALQASSRLHGHIVTGHVDATGTLISIEPEARSVRIVVEIPESLHHYVCKKGSICIDGVSLTVNDISGRSISVNVIPHTIQQTNFADYRAGTQVNLEVDIIARYLERLHSGSQ